MATDLPQPGTRARLIAAMLEGLRTRGYHGVGLAEVLAAAEAPKGVLYHHFPGGKRELAVCAIEAVLARIGAELDEAFARAVDPAAAIAGWLDAAMRVLEDSAFERGCPLATVALESGRDDAALREALARGFHDIRDRLQRALVLGGLPDATGRRLAALIVSAYEGALLQARVAASGAPLRDTAVALVQLVRYELAAHRALPA